MGAQSKDQVRTQDKEVVRKPRREALGETKPIGALILDFGPPES